MASEQPGGPSAKAVGEGEVAQSGAERLRTVSKTTDLPRKEVTEKNTGNDTIHKNNKHKKGMDKEQRTDHKQQ